MSTITIYYRIFSILLIACICKYVITVHMEQVLGKARLLNQRELAASLRVSKHTVIAWTKEGCPCVYYGIKCSPGRGSRPRYDLEKVKAWLDQRSKKRTSVA